MRRIVSDRDQGPVSLPKAHGSNVGIDDSLGRFASFRNLARAETHVFHFAVRTEYPPVGGNLHHLRASQPEVRNRLRLPNRGTRRRGYSLDRLAHESRIVELCAKPSRFK